MCIIIVSDIFGRTPELDKLCHAIIQDSESLKTKQIKHMFFSTALKSGTARELFRVARLIL